MIQLTVLIPTFGNDGTVFAESHHLAFEHYLAHAFGGFTRVSTPNRGGWFNEDGRYFADETYTFLVLVKSITMGSLVGEAVDFAKTHYEQEAIFVSYLGINEIL